MPERVAACTMGAEEEGVAVPDGGWDERAEGAWRCLYEANKRSPWLSVHHLAA